MGCSHFVHVGAGVLASFAGLTTMNKIERANLKREIETLCQVLQPGGKIEFNWSVKPLDEGMVKFDCRVTWRKTASFFERTPKSYVIPDVTYVRLFESHTFAPMKHFWELYQREPRYEVQVAILQSLLSIAGQEMQDRYGEDWREKVLLKSQGQDVVLDEKRAFATLHTLGGPRGGGDWIHIPRGSHLPEPHMLHPQLRGADDHRRWKAPLSGHPYEVDEIGPADDKDDIKHFQMLNRRISKRANLLPDVNGVYGRSRQSEDLDRSPTIGGAHQHGALRRYHSYRGRGEWPERQYLQHEGSQINGEGGSHRGHKRRRRHGKGSKQVDEESEEPRKDDDHTVKEDVPDGGRIEREQQNGDQPGNAP